MVATISTRSQAPKKSSYGVSALSSARLLLVGLIHAAVTCARPFTNSVDIYKEHHHSDVPDEPRSPEDAQLWIYLSVALLLVLLGGAFAGLTIALMGQDEIYLQVIAESGEGAEKKSAKKVLNLLKKGKHWVLVTLLVGNVITNETLPIVLDRSIGGGYAAAISSTVLVIIFGEIVPQSICVRFGLPIGAACAPFVLLLMWIFAPVSWPIAKLLDYLLGEDHGTTYKKAGLKTLVTLHQSLGDAENEGLNQDEVSIISGVLDLKAKAVGNIMTRINDVFTLPSDACLDEELMDEIMREGYSRIPIHKPKNRNDFVGMLLVKMLITYDPEDHKCVNEFSLATLPETSPETSCLDIINFFQEGKSHMVLVSDFPGDDHGALGVVTLEDVIEELIGEEIIDESDVYVDIHKAIRRPTLAPTHKARASKAEIAADRPQDQPNDGDDIENEPPKGDSEREPLLRAKSSGGDGKINPAHRASAVSLGDPRSSRAGSLFRRRSSGNSANPSNRSGPFNKFGPDLRDQLRNLGPSNAASRPKQTRVNTIRIKPGVGTIPEHPAVKEGEFVVPVNPDAQHGIGEDLMKPGFNIENGENGNANGYGTLDGGRSYRDTDTSNNEDEQDAKPSEPSEPSAAAATLVAQVEAAAENSDLPQGFPESHTADGDNLPDLPEKMVFGRVRSHESDEGEGGSVVGSLNSGGSSPKYVSHSSHHRKKTGTARSGSITESVVDAGGVKKLVLETAPSRGEDEDSERSTSVAVVEGNEGSSGSVTPAEDQKNGATNGASTPKSKAKKKKKKGKKNSVSN